MYAKGFAKIAKPLNGILATGSTNPKKNRNITDQWTPEYQDAFDALKWKLVEAPMPRSLKGLYHTSVCMLRGLLKLQNH